MPTLPYGLTDLLAMVSSRRIDHWRARLQEIKGRQTYKLLVDITDGCNLRCTFCPRQTGAMTTMSTESFDRILKNTQGKIDSFQLSCAWEYSVAKNAVAIIETLGKYEIPSTTIYTNGNIFPHALARAVVEAGIHHFVFSIGEARKETYERIRKGGRFERVLANIEKLVALKESLGRSLPRICANLTLTRANINELPDFIDLAHSLGMEEIRGRHLILNQGLNWDQDRIVDTKGADAIIARARQKARTHGIRFSVPFFHPSPGPKECRAPWHQFYVSATGDVSICPRVKQHVTIGNLIHETLAQIVAGHRLKRMRGEFLSRRFSNPVCGICDENKETDIAIDQGY